jgi:hypothetical protein
MVNKAVEDLVCSAYGGEVWEKIRERAGVDVDAFISNESYPDKITYSLVAAASEVLALPAEKVLELFGEHWVLKTAADGYGNLMRAGGRNLREFLINLPNFHSRVVLIFPDLSPPSFEVTDASDRSLRLHYRTHRPGLVPFVVGLMRGLGKMFDTEVSISLLSSREQGADHETFLIAW